MAHDGAHYANLGLIRVIGCWFRSGLPFGLEGRSSLGKAGCWPGICAGAGKSVWARVAPGKGVTVKVPVT